MKNNIIIVGAGTGGISVAARLQNRLGHLMKITIIDPQETHYYQPLWTLVGAGVFSHEETEKKQVEVIPSGVEWIKKRVTSFSPDKNSLSLDDNTELNYDYLVVAAGLQLDWHKIKGAEDALKTDYVCSNYLINGSTKTWKLLQNTQRGNAVFTQPPMPIKCGGAPQKTTYLADDYFRKMNRRNDLRVIFANSGHQIFGIEKYRTVLEEIVKRKDIDTRFKHNLVEIIPENKIAIFERPDKSRVELSYEMLHVVPPMSAPDFIKKSPLADSNGWVDVDKYSLQHVRYPNIYSLGDCAGTPNAKTGAAIRKQAPVLVENMISHLNGKSMIQKYDGYSSCPLITGYGKVVLAEFNYEGVPTETFPFNQAKERWSMWFLKAYILPKLYWWGMLKGKI